MTHHDPALTECQALAADAKHAARELALVHTRAKNDWLLACADALLARREEVLAANRVDLDAAPGFGLTDASVDRLRLTDARIGQMAEGLRQVAALPDPVGEVRSGSTRPNGLQVHQVGSPLGVILFLYESRPNVTTDAAALCVKAGNAVILRGGKEAASTNALLHRLMADQLADYGLPPSAIGRVATADRAAVGHLLKMHRSIDLCIPRGGKSLIERVVAEATMPVLKHYEGNCHLYVDADADIAMAVRLTINSKCQRPGTCNALETLLVHRQIAQEFFAAFAPAATAIECRGCERTRELLPNCKPATAEDYATEFLDLTLAVKVVESLDEAILHISEFGSGHTDGIVTDSLSAARRFQQSVDSSAVVVNASTRFNDGFELGLGAEVGISTDKFHARGPCGLRELTTTKYLITGSGQVRE